MLFEISPISLAVITFIVIKKYYLGLYPGGAVVESLPANAGDPGLSPDPGGSHMLWSS